MAPGPHCSSHLVSHGHTECLTSSPGSAAFSLKQLCFKEQSLQAAILPNEPCFWQGSGNTVFVCFLGNTRPEKVSSPFFENDFFCGDYCHMLNSLVICCMLWRVELHHGAKKNWKGSDLFIILRYNSHTITFTGLQYTHRVVQSLLLSHCTTSSTPPKQTRTHQHSLPSLPGTGFLSVQICCSWTFQISGLVQYVGFVSGVFTYHHAVRVPLRCSMDGHFIPFYDLMIVHCMNIAFCVSIHLPIYLFLINSKGDLFLSSSRRGNFFINLS